jgi:hypothetical protein
MSDVPHLPVVKLESEERRQNLVRAFVKLIPYAGEAIDQLSFGALEELRQKRVEQTLSEILEMLHRQQREPARTEEMANLLERAIPKVARAANEDVRQRFRDLLANAATVNADDARWAQVNLCEQLLAELDAPALALLVQLARYDGAEPIGVVSRPMSQVVSEKAFDWDRPAAGTHSIGYPWALVEEWLQR